jgi:hypothetical protein
MRSSTETLIAACKELAATVQCDDGIANSALRELAERLEELSKERADMVQAFRFFREVHAKTGLTLMCAAVLLGISPVTLSKWTATEPTTEPDFVD